MRAILGVMLILLGLMAAHASILIGLGLIVFGFCVIGE